jgi:hypothetical protein
MLLYTVYTHPLSLYLSLPLPPTLPSLAEITTCSPPPLPFCWAFFHSKSPNNSCFFNQNQLAETWISRYHIFFSITSQARIFVIVTAKFTACANNRFSFLPSDAKFLVPDWGDIVDSGIGSSYRPARQSRQAGRHDNPMPESTIHPPLGDYEFGYCFQMVALLLLQTGSTREKRYTGRGNEGLACNDGTRENRDKQGKCWLS